MKKEEVSHSYMLLAVAEFEKLIKAERKVEQFSDEVNRLAQYISKADMAEYVKQTEQIKSKA